MVDEYAGDQSNQPTENSPPDHQPTKMFCNHPFDDFLDHNRGKLFQAFFHDDADFFMNIFLLAVIKYQLTHSITEGGCFRYFR